MDPGHVPMSWAAPPPSGTESTHLVSPFPPDKNPLVEEPNAQKGRRQSEGVWPILQKVASLIENWTRHVPPEKDRPGSVGQERAGEPQPGKTCLGGDGHSPRQGHRLLGREALPHFRAYPSRLVWQQENIYFELPTASLYSCLDKPVREKTICATECHVSNMIL